MAIVSGDIKLLKSDTMSDVPEGGGAITGTVIIDGESNNIFDDISTLDRVYGAVHMRKVFPAVQTQTVDKYFGSHVIINKLPGDGKIGVNLFNTGDYFDRRPAAQSRVENYRAQGPVYAGFLWGTQYQGSRAVTIFQGESATAPGIGDVLLIKNSTNSQYIRIVRMDNSVQSFTDSQGVFKRRILDIEISDVLTHDFVGSEMNRLDTLTPEAKLYKTVVANAARYYSARPLAEAGSINDLTVKVDSVYSQVVPSSQSELALVDITAGATAVPLIDAASGTTSFSTSVSFSAGSIIHLGSPCLPGTLSIPVSSSTLVDEAGNIKSGATIVGTIDYAAGIMTFATSSPTYSGSKTVTFRPAAAPARVADTASIRVTAANRGYVWTINLNLPPKPGSLSVSYRSLSKWYELRDNSNGGLVGEEAGIGSGTVNYVSGSVTVTTAALPDADSDIIFAWGQPADFFNRSALTPGKFLIKHQLEQAGFDASTLTIAWNDGSARTASVNAAGVVSGYATGQLNLTTGILEFTPTTIPLGGTTFTFAYSHGAAISKTLTAFNVAGNNVTLDLGDTNITAGSLKIDWAAPWTADGQYTVPVGSGVIQQQDSDNGAGVLRGGRSSTIDYTAGTLTFDATVSASYKAADYSVGFAAVSDVGGMSGGESRTVTGYSDINVQTTIPASVNVSYRTGAAGSSISETLDLAQIEIDLTPGYAETIVSGAVLFSFGNRTYVDRSGQLFYGIDRQTGAGTYAGTIDYTSGLCTLSNWETGVSGTVTLKALLTTMNFNPIEFAVGLTPAAPVKVGVFQIRATPADGGGQIVATATNTGRISTSDIDGFVEYETGVWRVRFGQLVTAAGNEGEPWYDATQVDVDGKIFKPRFVLADSITYNTVAYTYLPLSSTILGLDPVRLPANGQVPIYAPGDVVVILHDETTTGTYTSGAVTDLGRVRIAKLTIRDAAGQMLDSAKYSANLDTGIIDWGSLVGVSQPLSIVDRIEDMAVLSDVQITGALTLSQPLTHNFPLNGTLVSNAIVYGTLYARTSVPFDQQTWSNVWSDTLSGSSVAAQYNNTQYPIVVDNASCIQERWAVVFTSSTAFNVTGEHVGQIVTGGSTSTETAPINPNTNQPYFTIPAAGWGSGWSSGNVLRFNTYGANAPTWIIQAIGQGEATSTDYTFCLEFRGDIDTP
ncbi:MAG: hypothetical protein ACXWT1_05885 [Methylobacter sp.]